MKPTRIVALVATIFLAGLVGKNAYAHPADMFFQSSNLRVSDTQIHVSWSIVPGSLIATLLWSDADLNQDDVITPDEAKTWAELNLTQFSARLNDIPLRWQLESVAWPTSMVKFQVGEETIVLDLTTDLPANLTGTAQLDLHNHYQEPISINWFEVEGDDGVMFHSPQQANGALLLDIELPGHDSPPDTTLIANWNTSVPSLEAAAVDSMGLIGITTEPNDTEQPQDPRASARLTRLIRSEDLSPSFLLLAFVIAGVLGSVHALTPGHGKTVVAAYLIGAKGTTRHAISLGAIVTLTHTGSVFLLGLVVLTASQYILPTRLFPILEVTSGLLIVGLGIYLLYGRWLARRAGHAHGHHHHHDHPHDHDHDHHDHDHHHHIPDRVTWRSLVALGISGGLVPCPDAIAILLVALAVNRIVFGLSLIVAFSLGLAVILIIIGLAMVHSRRLFDRMDAFNRITPIMPMVSAVIVLLLGLILTFNAIRGAEAMTFSANNGAVVDEMAPSSEALAARTETINPEQARILYMIQDEQGHPQLVIHRLSQAEPELLTQQLNGIGRYHLSPDKTNVIYSVPQDDGGVVLSLITLENMKQRQILVCPEVTCGNVAWSPDGQRIVYEKLDAGSPENPMGLPSLWWLAVDTGETQPVFPNSQWPGFNATWSPDGQWLSYSAPGIREIQLINLKDGQRHTIPNQIGNQTVWHPSGKFLLIEDMVTQTDGLFGHVLRFDLDRGDLVDLSQTANAEDSSPTWSPDGQWVALVRRTPSNPDAQIWLMRPDGSEARPLTHQADTYYGVPAWSPDGNYLLLQQTELKGSRESEIWMIKIDTGELQSIGTGQLPNWLSD